MISSLAVMMVLLFAAPAMARQLNPEEALSHARSEGQMLRRHAPSLAYSSKMMLAYTGRLEGVNCYYVFNDDENTDGGFLIVGADDLAPALLGYVPQGEFAYDRAPAAMKWWLGQYESGISQAVAKAEKIAVAKTSRPAVLPLVTTTWNQNAPYNNMCPTIGGQPTYTGCSATAMAQIMNYHQWPYMGFGSCKYTLEEKGLTVSAYFDDIYDWDNMLPDYSDGRYSQEQADAVAKLMYHCGASIKMDYGTDASGGGDWLIPFALNEHFDYDADVNDYWRMFYSDAEWENMLYEELAAKRPTLYVGVTENQEGHAFVCDGYDGNGLFHFNWGWGGSYDGYFTIHGAGALDPRGSGIGGGTVGYGFNQQQRCIMGIKKREGYHQPKVIMGCADGYVVECRDEAVTRDSELHLSGTIANYSADTVVVELGVKFVDEANGREYLSYVGYVELPILYGISGFRFFPLNVLKNGEYEVIPVCRRYRTEDEWQPVLLPPGTERPKITLTGEEPAVTLCSPVYVGDISTSTAPVNDVDLHVTATANRAVSGRTITGYIATLDGEDFIGNISGEVTLSAGETREFVFRKDMTGILTPGEVYVLYLYDNQDDAWLVPSYNYFCTFMVSEPSGMSAVKELEDNRVDVYGVSGRKLRRGMPKSEALDGLSKGVYIVGGKKVVRR